MNSTRAEIEERGFSIVPRIFLQHETDNLIRHLEESELRRSKAGIRHALKNDAVRKLATEPRLLSIAKEILGDGAFPFRATLFDKSPRANWLVVWHQDAALPLRQRHDAAGWGHLDDSNALRLSSAGNTHRKRSASTWQRALAGACAYVTPSFNADNGPLRVLPGSHVKGVLSDDDIEQLVRRIPALDCFVPQGGVLAMRPLVEYAACTSLAAGLEIAIT